MSEDTDGITARLAVLESGHEILVEDFQKSRARTEVLVDRIFQKTDVLKTTLAREIKEEYMTQTAAELLEQRLANDTRSIKLWIVSTVSGCTSAGVFVMWLLKVPM